MRCQGNILVYMYHLKHEVALAACLLALRNDTPIIKVYIKIQQHFSTSCISFRLLLRPWEWEGK